MFDDLEKMLFLVIVSIFFKKRFIFVVNDVKIKVLIRILKFNRCKILKLYYYL